MIGNCLVQIVQIVFFPRRRENELEAEKQFTRVKGYREPSMRYLRSSVPVSPAKNIGNLDQNRGWESHQGLTYIPERLELEVTTVVSNQSSGLSGRRSSTPNRRAAGIGTAGSMPAEEVKL